MAKAPRILVLMATFNGQSYLAEQLDSILCQEGVDVTLRISDDCSTDNTFRILETYASEHANIEIIYNTQNKGALRNFMDLVYDAPADEYDYFAIANQDDVWHLDKLAAAAAHISANTSRAELYYAGVTDVDEQGSVLGNEYLPYEVCADHTGSLLLVQNWCLGCTMLMNGALIKLLRQHPVYDFERTYDAWIHAVALYCGGYVYCDLRHSYVDRRITDSNTVGNMNEGRSRESIAKKATREPGHGAPETTEKYTKMALALLREYKQEMDSDTAKLVEAVAARRESGKARRFLFRRRDIMMTTNVHTTRLRWMVLLNKF